MLTGQERIEECLRAATSARQRILDAGDEVPFKLKLEILAVADESLNLVRFTGNLIIAAFFGGENDRQRETRREDLLARLTEYLTKADMRLRPTDAEKALLAGPKGILPFHWEIEFPEVFGGEDAGFDCIISNPPFAGKNTFINSVAPAYPDWLKSLHEESHGNADLVAHFFRRAFVLMRPLGSSGLIATKTIRQGDTRKTGLRWLCANGGVIYSAARRRTWPGQAAVIISVVHVAKGIIPGPYCLDDDSVPTITAYLFHQGTSDDAVQLSANEGRCFVGNNVLGLGFTFDDSERDGSANSLEDMRRILARDGKNAARIFPYINGADVNDHPTHKAPRQIINFEQMTEEEARRWPDLMSVLEAKVKPERLAQKREARARYWWRFAEPSPGLYNAIRDLPRVLVRSLTSTHFATFTFLPNRMVYDQTLIVFALHFSSALAVLCSRVHETWALFQGASMKDDPRYNVINCFKTFPFPENYELNANLEAAGNAYYEYRAALMVNNNEGLTKTYNRFHDPNERSPDLLQLRDLHAAMDRAVLDAYGWTDLKPTCEFLLDYEEEEDEEEGSGVRNQGSARRRKKPWRYRWPDDFRDVVLARLLELNKQRAEEERLAGDAAEAKEKKPVRRAGRKKRNSQGGKLF
jgi:hypothetical protein